MHIIGTRLLIHALCRQRLKNTFVLTLGVVSRGNHSFVKQVDNKKKMSDMVVKRVDDIIKSEEDKRSYRGLVLRNQMKVLLVSDSSTDKSAAAMDINVGNLSDPDHLPGLAHFCEHMLFLGTEKYPIENDYMKFTSQHGGMSNATTFPDHTNYYFDILPEHLHSALDRFAQFFLHPLFTESATERELNAVNSEHEKNVSSDNWRLYQLDRHSCDPSHPFHKFGTGNKMTLDIGPKERGIDVRDELLKFHAQWYSANIMSLAVLGKESLDELEAMVVELFADVENKNVEAPSWPVHPFKAEQMGTCTQVVPVKDIRNLNIVFPCEDLSQYYESGPGDYIGNLVGHEGPGSILSALKEKGWSNKLYAGYKEPHRGTGFFGVSVDLTEEGLKHTDEIILMIFQYLNMLKQSPPIRTYHDEQRDIAAMTFRFKDKESPRSYIESLTHKVQEYPFEHVLCNHYLLTDWRPEIITQVLENCTPDNIRVAIIAKKFEAVADQREPWYNTPYKLFRIPETTLESWRNAGLSKELHLPEKNDFIPDEFDLYPADKDITEHPAIVKDTAITRVWFKQDDNYLLPKTNLMFDFVSPLAYLDPLSCNLTHMFTQLFRDSLNQYAYAAELAGLNWELSNTKYGLILSVGGFSTKQHLLLEKIIQSLCEFKIDPKRFEIYKENYTRTLKNFSAEQPYQHAVYYLAVLLTEHSWTKQELLATMDQVTIDRLEAFIPQILSKMHIECFIHGNANKQKALDLVDIVENRLSEAVRMSPLLPRQLLLNRELKLEDGCNYLYNIQNDIHKSSCVEIYYQCGMQTKQSNVLLDLFAHIIQEPCFNELRTKQQLGYIVFSGMRRSNGVQGLRIIVQSDRHPEYVDERIEEFLRNMLSHLEDMPAAEFQKHKDSLAAQRLEKPKQLSMQSYIFWSEITSQQYHFDRANVEVEYLRTVEKSDVIAFYKQLLAEDAAQRHKISVHVLSTAEGGAGCDNPAHSVLNGNVENNLTPPATTPSPKQTTPINDITVFKSAHGMHPLVQPYMNITRKGNKCKL
ncbi:insulin-degrading enzyme isoform X2 [Atheta coriaria]|uniref:insulin-degrading enzyme isoform X2 n=1 Tax=Dalotia coriaria TaxID=877792 RepID=UPI0031F39927